LTFRAISVDFPRAAPRAPHSATTLEIAAIRRPMRNLPLPPKEGPRVNRDIRIREVMLIDADGQNKGVVPTFEAIQMAEDQGLDLVEVAPMAQPPVCKIMDYGKFKFQEQKKAAEARRNQKIVEVKEIKLRPGIDDHDYGVKMRQMKEFFEEGNKVKVTLRFRGREMAHQGLGMRVLDRVKAETAPLAKVESEPSMEGRQMTMVLAPR
jgi:translation initiation factor IF-3